MVMGKKRSFWERLTGGANVEEENDESKKGSMGGG